MNGPYDKTNHSSESVGRKHKIVLYQLTVWTYDQTSPEFCSIPCISVPAEAIAATTRQTAADEGVKTDVEIRLLCIVRDYTTAATEGRDCAPSVSG